MFSDFTFWLMQQPKEIQFWWYVGMFAVLTICIISAMIQEHRAE